MITISTHKEVGKYCDSCRSDAVQQVEVALGDLPVSPKVVYLCEHCTEILAKKLSMREG